MENKTDGHPDAARFTARHQQPAQKSLEDRMAKCGKGVWFPYQTEFHLVIQRKMGASNLPGNRDGKLPGM